MIDPTTLSLADLAAAVVRMGAYRTWSFVRGANGETLADVSGHTDEMDHLLAAANRLPAVVAELAEMTILVRDIAEADCSFDDDCPLMSSRHPACGPCRARTILATLVTP